MEHAVAGPFASRQLADLGANRGKQSLAADIKTAEGKHIVGKILEKADILIQNLAPGAMQRMGMDFDSLHEKYPRLIVCDISGYGEGGPLSDKKAYDLLIQAAAGLISVTGTPDQPARVGISIADIAAGMYAYSGMLSALLQRARTGRGLRVEVSMLEALAEWMAYPLNFAHYGGTAPARSGLTHPSIAPYGQYTAGDGQSLIFGLQNDREWHSFCTHVRQARERWREVATPTGSIQALLPPATLSDAEAAMGAVPALGEHTQALWEEFGGR